MNEATQLVSIAGGVAGFMALLGLGVTFGVYREKIDRHDKILNVMVQEGLIRSWRNGHLQSTGNPTYRPNKEIIERVPDDVRSVCDRIGRKRKLNYSGVASEILGKVGNEPLDRLARELNTTPIEALGILVGYTLSVNEGKAP